MDYFKKLSNTLKLEYHEDKAQYQALSQNHSIADKRAAGIVWYPVAIRSQELDRADYLTVELEKHHHADSTDQMRASMPALLFSNHDRQHCHIEGTIKHVHANKLKLSIKQDQLPDWASDGKLGVELLFDDKSYDEMNAALKQAETIWSNSKPSPQQELLQVLLGQKVAGFEEIQPEYTNPTLNHSQCQAVHKVLTASHVAIIHGPPGTGKTTTLVQAIRALANSKPKPILVVAPSNTAVDLLTEKLHEAGLRVVRIGNPSRISEKLMALTLDGQLLNHPDTANTKKLKKQAAEYKNMAHKYKRSFGKAERDQRKALFDEAHKIMQEVQKAEEYKTNNILDHAQVITATLVGSNHYTVQQLDYLAVVIDEAAQALEPACFIPILKAPKLILAGDHQQLPPTIKSQQAAQQGLAHTLFEKLCSSQAQALTMLATQYRMHSQIMGFASEQFYQGQLQAHPSVANRKLSTADSSPVLFIDTAGTGYDETPNGTSCTNEQEAQLLISYMGSYLASHSIPVHTSVAVISPYKKQVEYLQQSISTMPHYEQRKAAISVNTIDSFQGQERDLVAISLVRSNPQGDIGFLADIRRMNVAMTRARAKLIVIGNSATLGQSAFYSQFIQYCEQNQGYLSAWELPSLQMQ
jgi:ATP-dependent RNA/DNA helicase IGHMBP2